MQVCISLQTDNHASTPPLKFFTGRMPFLPPNQQRQSTEGREAGIGSKQIITTIHTRLLMHKTIFSFISICKKISHVQLETELSGIQSFYSVVSSCFLLPPLYYERKSSPTSRVTITTDRVSEVGNKIGRVRPPVCFHSIFWTG